MTVSVLVRVCVPTQHACPGCFASSRPHVLRRGRRRVPPRPHNYHDRERLSGLTEIGSRFDNCDTDADDSFDAEQIGDLGSARKARFAVETQQQDRVFILDAGVRVWQCMAGASQKYLRRERIPRQELEQPLSQRRTSVDPAAATWARLRRHGCPRDRAAPPADGCRAASERTLAARGLPARGLPHAPHTSSSAARTAQRRPPTTQLS
jgi:hypothetical protein